MVSALRSTTTALLLLVLGAHLASCEELRSRRSPVIRRARGVPTTGCYIVAMKDDASEQELQQAATKAAKASDDAKLHGLVQKVKKAFTVKLNPYALEMVREGREGLRLMRESKLISFSSGATSSWSRLHRRGRVCSWRSERYHLTMAGGPH